MIKNNFEDKVRVRFEVSIDRVEEKRRLKEDPTRSTRTDWVHKAIKELFQWTLMKERLDGMFGPQEVWDKIPPEMLRLITGPHVDICWWVVDDITRQPDNHNLSDKKSIREVTCWYRFNPKTGGYHFNHIEFDWAGTRKPKPMSESQKGWLKDQWISQYAYLNDNNEVVYDIGDDPKLLPRKSFY